eukprot:TRINITY_DN9895_c0_g3_i2.p2 TRINITY_DN9895_c0_g3~~TRINITY_DN9895_c0_g3_i2.p2  ORF type:complete len:248 (+),score=45.89 TRINITY_DN9895_c0_g3_i2:64-807(+)
MPRSSVGGSGFKNWRVASAKPICGTRGWGGRSADLAVHSICWGCGTQRHFWSPQMFVTLSPLPGFLKWLLPKLIFHTQGVAEVEGAAANPMAAFREEHFLLPEETAVLQAAFGGADAYGALHEALANPLLWSHEEKKAAALRAPLLRLAARYLVWEKKRGRALDPVANFHIRNGAQVERLNWRADLSPRGMALSAGIMVNYQYKLDAIEANHLEYLSTGTVAASPAVRALLGEPERAATTHPLPSPL